MVRLFALALASSALAATLTLTTPGVAQSQAAVAPKPQFGSFGFDEAGMDRSIAPGDNFYLFANGGWMKNTAIPADKASFGAFEQLQDLSDARTRDLLEAARTDPSSKIGTALTVARMRAATCPLVNSLE